MDLCELHRRVLVWIQVDLGGFTWIRVDFAAVRLCRDRHGNDMRMAECFAVPDACHIDPQPLHCDP